MPSKKYDVSKFTHVGYIGYTSTILNPSQPPCSRFFSPLPWSTGESQVVGQCCHQPQRGPHLGCQQCGLRTLAGHVGSEAHQRQWRAGGGSQGTPGDPTGDPTGDPRGRHCRPGAGTFLFSEAYEFPCFLAELSKKRVLVVTQRWKSNLLYIYIIYHILLF